MFNRLKYAPSFIQRAVQLALRADQTTAKTAQDLDVKESTLYNWILTVDDNSSGKKLVLLYNMKNSAMV